MGHRQRLPLTLGHLLWHHYRCAKIVIKFVPTNCFPMTRLRKPHMSIHKGSLSISRYRLVCPEKKILDASLENSWRKYQFENIPGGEKRVTEIKAGWVLPNELADSEEHEYGYWDKSHLKLSSGYLHRLRIERRRVPGEFFQLEFKKRLLQAQDHPDFTSKKVSLQNKKEIRENLKQELIERCLPQISHIDAYQSDNNKLYVFTRAKANLEIFETFFRKSFLEDTGSVMIPLTPINMGLSEKEWKGVPDQDASLGATIKHIRQIVPALMCPQPSM